MIEILLSAILVTIVALAFVINYGLTNVANAILIAADKYEEGGFSPDKINITE